MLKKISYIKDFGVFGNFTGTTLPDFAAFNLIYGWNYSGKTTLSRVFRCLEKSEVHRDYPGASFEISHSDGTKIDLNNSANYKIRVFNEDFRSEHLRWDELGGINPVLLLGAENIELHDTLERKEKQRTELNELSAGARERARKISDTIGKAETECASEIVKELSVGRFNKTGLRPIIASWNGSIPAPLSADQVKAARAKSNSEQKEILPNLNVSVPIVTEIVEELRGILLEQIDTSHSIERLVRYPNVAIWVERGLPLHEDKSHCEFCESELTSARRVALNAHFSQAFMDLKRRIESIQERLLGLRVELSGALYGRSSFYTDFKERHKEAGDALGLARSHWNNEIQLLVNALEQKKENPFVIIQCPDVVLDRLTLSTCLLEFQTLIDENNARTRAFASARAEGIEILKRHYTAEAMRRIDRFALVAEADKLLSEVTATEEKIGVLDEEITGIRLQLSNATKGADAINSALRSFFGKSDIHIVVSNERFQLMRGANPARNLSEGERTAIAFCYFVVKLSENGNDLLQTIVYIDDPISSLDAHHLLHMNSYIKDTFYEFDENKNPKHVQKSMQVFISTHNYEFFHLALDWMSKMKEAQYSVYMVERSDSNGRTASALKACPDSIRKYKSEYLFLFHQLANYLDNPTNDPVVVFNIGNMARRFLEGYLAFKLLEHAKIDNTLPELITDTVACDRARKFMHFYSHTLSRSGGMRIADMSEAHAVLSIILDAVRQHDPVHYRALERTRPV